MYIDKILELLDKHPHTGNVQSSYKALYVKNLYILSEISTSRQTMITDRLTGETVFSGSLTETIKRKDGEWKIILDEELKNINEETDELDDVFERLLPTGGNTDTSESSSSEVSTEKEDPENNIPSPNLGEDDSKDKEVAVQGFTTENPKGRHIWKK